jgi:RNA polymerase sigma factor (sigma-70 family)
VSTEVPAPTEEEQRLVRSALHLVDECALDLALRWSHLIKSHKELYAEGVFGLYRAATKYREEKNPHFPTYARFKILGAMRDSLRVEQFHDRLRRAAEDAVDEHLAEHRDIERNAFIYEEEDARRRLRSFATGVFTATFAAGLDAVMREQGEEALALRREYATAIDGLRRSLAMIAPHESQILLLVYGHKKTLDESSKELGITYIDARRRHARALERLLVYLQVHGVTRAPPSMDLPSVGTVLPANESEPPK